MSNILADALAARQTGYADQQTIDDQIGRRQAGSQIANGNYQGGANVLYNAGQLTPGAQVQTYGQGQDTRQANIAGATAFQAGDYDASGQAYAGSGNLEGVQAADQAQTEDRATQLAATQRVSAALRKVIQTSGPQAAAAAWDAAAPVLSQMGVAPDHQDALKQAFVANPTGFLDTIDATVAKEKGVVVAPGDQVVRPTSGEVVARVPNKPTYEKLGPNDSLVQIPDPNSPPGAPAPAAALAPPAAAGAPRNQRNNNPGNIEDGAFAQSLPGYVGTDGRFAKFADPSSGSQAQVALLGSYGKRGINTVAGIINRWAPPSDGNDTTAYANFVANKIGVKPGQQLDMTDPGTLSDIAGAIQQFEGGTHSHSNAPALAGASAAPALGGSGADTLGGGATVIARGQPKGPTWTSDGKGNLINANGDRKVDPTAAAGVEADPNIVQAVIDGRYPPPTGYAATKPAWQAVLQAAAAQDPTFNAGDYHTRYMTRRDFTSGKSAQNITALNTAMNHIGDLDKQVDGLDNTSFTALNRIGNAYADATGDPRIKDFNTNKTAVADELTRVFRQSGGTAADVQGFQNDLDAAGSPAQLHTVIKRMTTLLGSRLDALANQYQQGTGKATDPLQFLNPKAQATYTRLTGVAPTTSSAPPGTGAPTGGQASAGGGTAIAKAKAAIAQGAPRDKVIQRLRAYGIDTTGL